MCPSALAIISSERCPVERTTPPTTPDYTISNPFVCGSRKFAGRSRVHRRESAHSAKSVLGRVCVCVYSGLRSARVCGDNDDDKRDARNVLLQHFARRVRGQNKQLLRSWIKKTHTLTRHTSPWSHIYLYIHTHTGCGLRHFFEYMYA